MPELTSIKPVYIMTRPYALENGKEYFLRVRQDDVSYPTYLPVKFIHYEPCPALATVSTSDGWLWKVLRDDLFIAEAALSD